MRFIGTFNNPQDHVKDFMLPTWLEHVHNTLECEFTIGQLEQGEQGTPHVQFAIWLPKGKKARATQLAKKIPGVHWEGVKQDNGVSSYVTKEEGRLEGPYQFGKEPLNWNVKGNRAKSIERNRLIMEKPLHELVDEGLISATMAHQVKKSQDAYKASKAEASVQALQGDLLSHNIWLWGQAGIGKTGWFVDYFKDHGGLYNKDKSKYWNMYAGQDGVLINDVELKEDFLLGSLKRWAEHQPFPAEDKYGSFVTIRPKHIVVTSNYTPNQIWPSMEEREPILRRFKVVNMTKPYYPEGHPDYKEEDRAKTLSPED